MASISSIGVGSGLPLNELLADLRKSENNALVAIQNQQITAQNRFTAYSQLKSSIEALKTAGETLGGANTFGAFKTSVSADTFTASADISAIAGKYSIAVDALASSQTLVTKGLASRSDANGEGGIITFTLGDGSEKTLDLAGKGTSLDSLVKAINADSSLGVQATLVNDGSGTPFRLLLSTTETGTDAAIGTIQVSGNSTLQAMLGFEQSNPAANPDITETAATNAAIRINGIEISAQGNTITDAIEGVTLNLAKADPGVTSSLVVSRDDAAADKAINAFVTAYNNLQNVIKTLTSYDVTTQKSSALTGDALARRTQTQFRDVLNVALPSGSMRSLSQMGITTNPSTGLLDVDSKKLAEALKNDLGDVQELFTGENGITKRLESVAKSFLGTNGYIDTATDSANTTIENLQKQYDTTSARIEAKMAAYSAQFSALDSMMAQMNSVSTYLTQQLAMLSNLNSGNNK